MAKPKVVRVTWRDSAAYQGWENYDGGGPHTVESIGFLVAETDDHLAIATSYDSKPNSVPWCQITVIPNEAIVAKQVIRA